MSYTVGVFLAWVLYRLSVGFVKLIALPVLIFGRRW